MSDTALDFAALLGGSPTLPRSPDKERAAPVDGKKPGRRKSKRAAAGGEEGDEDEEEVVPLLTIAQRGPNACPFPKPETFDPGPSPQHKIHPKLPHKETDQDKLIPRTGFIRDFCYSMYGCESPTVFNLWAALFTIAVSSSRQAWFKWELGGHLWPNLYYIVVAPPGVCHKGAALRQSDRIIEGLQEALEPDPIMHDEKDVMSISSKASADAVFLALAMKQKTYVVEGGGFHQVNYGSRAYVLAEELGTFLNTKKFNSGLIDTLTDLYDCKNRDKELTRMRGDERYEKIFFNLAGACTPRHLKSALPPEAWDGGFMSRCVLVNQRFPSNSFYMPVHYDGYPTDDDLIQKLGWIVYHARGEYHLSEEAESFYAEWYGTFTESMYKQRNREQVYDKSRMPQLILRVATLMRMADYVEGQVIELEHLKASMALLAYTFGYSRQITEDANISEFARRYAIVRKYIQTRERVKRKDLLKACSGGHKRIPAKDMSSAVDQLKQEGLISILRPSGHEGATVGIDGNELYVWIATEDDLLRNMQESAFIAAIQAEEKEEEDDDGSPAPA